MKRSSRRVAFAAVLLCLGAGAIAAVMLWPHEATEPSPSPAPLANNAPAAPVAESAAIAESHGLVTRAGATLDLRMKSGEVVTLTDRAKCGDLPCPAGLATSYRYLGWDEKIGGYRLSVAFNAAQPMVLTYGDDDPTPLPAKAPAAVATDESLSGWLKDLTEERDETEKPAIAAHPQRIQRDGGKLSVILDDKRRLTFEDDLVCGQLACPPQVSRSFDYVGDSPDGHFHLVRQQWNESESAMLIDGTGTILTLPSVPSFSPDGKFIVSVVSDLEEAQPQRVQVWSLADGKITSVFAIPARGEDDTVYELVGWSDPAHLRLKRGPWGGDKRSPVTLAHDAQGWHLVESGNAE